MENTLKSLIGMMIWVREWNDDFYRHIIHATYTQYTRPTYSIAHTHTKHTMPILHTQNIYFTLTMCTQCTLYSQHTFTQPMCPLEFCMILEIRIV